MLGVLALNSLYIESSFISLQRLKCFFPQWLTKLHFFVYLNIITTVKLNIHWRNKKVFHYLVLLWKSLTAYLILKYKTHYHNRSYIIMKYRLVKQIEICYHFLYFLIIRKFKFSLNYVINIFQTALSVTYFIEPNVFHKYLVKNCFSCSKRYLNTFTIWTINQQK